MASFQLGTGRGQRRFLRKPRQDQRMLATGDPASHPTFLSQQNKERTMLSLETTRNPPAPPSMLTHSCFEALKYDALWPYGSTVLGLGSLKRYSPNHPSGPCKSSGCPIRTYVHALHRISLLCLCRSLLMRLPVGTNTTPQRARWGSGLEQVAPLWAAANFLGIGSWR